MLPMPFDNPTTYPGHTGIDFGQSSKTFIPASGPGVVTMVSCNPRSGYVTWVRYDEYPDREAGYAHQDTDNQPGAGTRVDEGSWLGYVGSYGVNSTGPHLHLEIDPGATSAAVWAMFDSNRVVNQTGGNATPMEDDMPLNDDDKTWIRDTIRAEIGGALGAYTPAIAGAVAAEPLNASETDWIRTAVQQEIGGALSAFTPGIAAAVVAAMKN